MLRLKLDGNAKDCKKKKSCLGCMLILYFDSGGQPQYHELVPAVSHNVSLVQIFIKLNERLDDFVYSCLY